MGTYVECNGCGSRLSGKTAVITYEYRHLCEECFKEEIWELNAEQIAERMLLDVAEAAEFLPAEG